MNRPVGITLGEPCGIGPEILVRSLQHADFSDVECVVFGSPKRLLREAEQLGIQPVSELKNVRVVSAGPDRESFDLADRQARAAATMAAIDGAVSDAMNGSIGALVTAPIDKSVIRSILPQFTGHTGYLAEKAGVPKTLMMLDNTELRVVLMTEHIPLREVPSAVTRQSLESTIRLAVESLRTQFGIRTPRIAVLGLNPHAGEIAEPSEEETILRPVIGKLANDGLEIQGPFPADSFFAKARNAGWDFILSLFHDQGLIAAKYAGLDKVVNITLGLPFLRTSPGHGTAYDLVGKQIADTRSFERALKIAATRRL